MAEDVQRVPRIIWNLVVALLATLGTGLGSTVGMIAYAVYDHESRLTVIEASRFTSADGASIAAQMRSESSAYQAEIRGDLKEIRTDIGALRREFDRAFAGTK